MNLGHQFHFYRLSCRCRNGAGRFRDCHIASDGWIHNQSRSPKLRSWLSAEVGELQLRYGTTTAHMPLEKGQGQGQGRQWGRAGPQSWYQAGVCGWRFEGRLALTAPHVIRVHMTPTSAHPQGFQTPLGLGLSLTCIPLCPAHWGLGVALQMPRGNLVSLVRLAPSALRLRGEDSVEPTSHPGCRAHWGDMGAAPRVLTLGALSSGLGWGLRRCSPLLLCPGFLAHLCIPTPLDSDPAGDEYTPLPFTPLPVLLSHPHSEASAGVNPDHAEVTCPGSSMRDRSCSPGCLGLFTVPPPPPPSQL